MFNTIIQLQLYIVWKIYSIFKNCGGCGHISDITLSKIVTGSTKAFTIIGLPLRFLRRTPRGLFCTSVLSMALQKEQWQTWGLLLGT